jgi:hypothetical protein
MSAIGAWRALLVFLLAAGQAHAQHPFGPALEAVREQLEEEGMDLVRVTVTSTVALRDGDVVDLEFPANSPPGTRTILEGVVVIRVEAEPSGPGRAAFVAVPMEVSRMLREAEEERSGFILYPRLEIDDLEFNTDPNGPNDRLILPVEPWLDLPGRFDQGTLAEPARGQAVSS